MLIHNRHSKYIILANNQAIYGGGICLEASFKFYIKGHQELHRKLYITLKTQQTIEGQYMLLTALLLVHVQVAKYRQSQHLYRLSALFTDFKTSNRK